MLLTEPMDRPRDAGEVLRELETLEATLPRSSTGTRPGAVRVRRRWPRWATGLAAAVLVIVAAGGGALASGRWAAPAPGAEAALAFGPNASSIGCRWERLSWHELDRLPEGAIPRSGEVGGQGVAEVDGRKAWKITSDWGQIAIPLGRLEGADPFAVEAEVFVPHQAGWMRGAALHLFTEPAGGRETGSLVHGINLTIAEEPGKPPYFEWFEYSGIDERRGVYAGTLPAPLGGRWRSLRIEGSPSKGWFRGLLDGRAVVVARGTYDLSGKYVALGAGYGYMNPEDVAWANLRMFSGTPECQ